MHNAVHTAVWHSSIHADNVCSCSIHVFFFFSFLRVFWLAGSSCRKHSAPLNHQQPEMSSPDCINLNIPANTTKRNFVESKFVEGTRPQNQPNATSEQQKDLPLHHFSRSLHPPQHLIGSGRHHLQHSHKWISQRQILILRELRNLLPSPVCICSSCFLLTLGLRLFLCVSFLLFLTQWDAEWLNP